LKYNVSSYFVWAQELFSDLGRRTWMTEFKNSVRRITSGPKRGEEAGETSMMRNFMISSVHKNI
jgi:hypothetical protein